LSLDMHYYMHAVDMQPEGYVYSDHPNWVCLLLKSLYGIKQAPRVWTETLHKFFLIKSNFNQSDVDSCVYTRLNKTIKTLMTVYFDDLTLIGLPHNISEIKKHLASRFPITDLGPAKSILGVEVIQDFKGGTTTLCQGSHIAALLKFAPTDKPEATSYLPC